MKWIDLFYLAAQNLWRRRMRTVLTVLGVIIGTACIILMVSLGLSNIAQTEAYYARQNLAKIDVHTGYSNNMQLTDYTVSAFLALPGVKAASPMLDLALYVTQGNYEAAYLNVYGVDITVLEGLELSQGSLFCETSAMPEIVLGADAKLNFQDPKNPVDYYRDWDWSSGTSPEGPNIEWLNEQFNITFGGKHMLEQGDPELPAPRSYRGRIVGIQTGDSYQSYISLAVGKQIKIENRKLIDARELNNYRQAIVIADDVEQVVDVIAAIKAMGFEAYSPAESIKMMQEEQQRQQGQLLTIALISLLVSAIGIANTMLASILERRAEIGVMKVIGMKISKIRMLFLIEAAIIGLCGGIIGNLTAFLFAFILNNGGGGSDTVILGMYFGQGVKLIMPFWLVAGAISIAVITGVISGVYPAYKATKMSPLEAIRG